MKTRIQDIEILRAIAVLMVLVHHAGSDLFTWKSPALERFYVYFGGWVGVDLFFAISGFLIARTLVPQLRTAPSAQATQLILSFWVRRAWRLLPSAWLWLGLILIATVCFNSSGVFGSLRSNIEATVVGVLNIANIRFAESFMNWPYGASFVYWSLSLEEQFYLVFPLLILLSRRYLVWVMAALVVLPFFTLRTPMLMAFRTDAIALGVLLALWSFTPSYQLLRPTFLQRWGWAHVGGAILCLGILGSDQLHTVSVRVSIIALLCATLVWSASYDAQHLARAKLLTPILLWLGSRSYGIYLIHIPAYYASRELWLRLGHDPSLATMFWPLALTALTLILLLSELNYRLVESPLRRKGQRIAQRLAMQKSADAPEVTSQPATRTGPHP